LPPCSAAVAYLSAANVAAKRAGSAAERTSLENLLVDASQDCAARVAMGNGWCADTATLGPPVTEVQPPEDEGLRRTIDAMAPFVARNGAAFEAIAVRQNARDNRFSFLKGGPGAEYYRWRVQAGFCRTPNPQS
jgi:hypothetical protein